MALRVAGRRIRSFSLANFNARESIQLLESFEHLRQLKLSGQRFGDSNGDGLADVVCRPGLELLRLNKSRPVPNYAAALDLQWSQVERSRAVALRSLRFNAETFTPSDRTFLDAFGSQASVLELLELEMDEGDTSGQQENQLLQFPYLQTLQLRGFTRAVLNVNRHFRAPRLRHFHLELDSTPPFGDDTSLSRLLDRHPSARTTISLARLSPVEDRPKMNTDFQAACVARGIHLRASPTLVYDPF